MRRILILVFIFLLSPLLRAQVPAFPFDSAQWYVLNIMTGNQWTVYSTGQDSVINGKTYTSIWTDFYDFNIADTNNLQMFIRPDSSNRVWFRYASTVSNDTNEYVLYDFSLQVGDTFYLQHLFQNMPDPQIVQNIYSAQLLDGTPINHFSFIGGATNCNAFSCGEIHGADNPFYPLAGLPTCPDTCEVTFGCMSYNGVSVWGYTPSCVLGSGVHNYSPSPCKAEKTQSNYESIYYKLDCARGAAIQIQVYDLMGRLLYEDIASAEQISVPVNNNQLVLVKLSWENQAISFIQAN